jgi:hypothetical protein
VTTVLEGSAAARVLPVSLPVVLLLSVPPLAIAVSASPMALLIRSLTADADAAVQKSDAVISTTSNNEITFLTLFMARSPSYKNTFFFILSINSKLILLRYH